MNIIKLTDALGRTRPNKMNEIKWDEGVENRAPGGGKICSAAYIHGYLTVYQAVVMNPIHANFPHPLGWECDADVELNDGTKLGCTRMRVLRRIELPVYRSEQLVYLAITASLKVFTVPDYVQWASNWLDGSDRSATSAASTWAANSAESTALLATWAANSAEYAAMFAAWSEASHAEYAALFAAWSAASHAEYAAMFAAKSTASYAEYAAMFAAKSAEYAARSTEYTNNTLDICALAEEAYRWTG